MLKQAIARLTDRGDLTRAEVRDVFELIFSGAATSAQLGAFIVALRMKGETPEEIAGAAEIMRERATRVSTPPGAIVLDTCGTGGDGAGTFNVSTAVALIAAAAGVTVAKHGNRSVSSRSGSADVLAAAGVNIHAGVPTVERCIRELGIGFLFAPNLHGVMKHVAATRSELGLRSVFNLLGPLSNPARASRQLLGVYDRRLVPVVARTLAALGAERALVVHGEPGLDELSPCGITTAAWVEGGSVRDLVITPEDAGIPRVSLDCLAGGEPEENAATLARVLGGEPGPLQHALALNAGAALWVAGVAQSLKGGAELARELLQSGSAGEKLKRLAAMSTEDAR